MIERYTLPEIGRVWSEAHKYQLWCDVERLVLEAHADDGVVPADAVEPVRQAPAPTPEAVAEIEEVTQHDVIAFLTAWADNTTPREAAAYVHFGMTSSDLLDTALALQLRDGISEWVAALGIIATVCEAIALEVRHGQRTEVRELSEAFGSGQKGSSAMPHKKNPIRSERIAGLARVVRAAVVPVMEGIPLWHERDISHSSTERVFLPDAAITTDYLLNLTAGLVENLVVDAERMRANLESTGGLIYTSSVLLELVEGGMSREDAYALVQGAAMETWNTGTPFRETLRARASSSGVTLDEARLDEICRPEKYVANLGPLFDRLAALS